MAVRTETPGPYAPPTTTLQVIEKYRNHGLQTPFDQEVLLRAGVTESLTNRTLQTLTTLDLIDSEGEPTETLRGIAEAPEAEYQARLADAIRAAYDEVFQYVDPATATETQIRDAFRVYNPRGQQGRMVTLFVGLCQAAGIISEAPPRPAKKSQGRSTSTKKTSSSKKRESSDTNPAKKHRIPPALSALLESLPAEGETWTTAKREDFVNAFGVLLDLFYAIDDTGEE